MTERAGACAPAEDDRAAHWESMLKMKSFPPLFAMRLHYLWPVIHFPTLIESSERKHQLSRWSRSLRGNPAL